jgi:penicillin-binding protein 1A
MWMPDGVDAINVDPTTGTRDNSGVIEYFYHENPPPQIESSTPIPLNSSQGIEGVGASLNQAQQLLQPEIVLSPSAANKSTSSSGLNNSSQHTPSDSQNTAAKILKPN